MNKPKTLTERLKERVVQEALQQANKSKTEKEIAIEKLRQLKNKLK